MNLTFSLNDALSCLHWIQGDSVLNQALSEIGGKGLFTKELDVHLLSDSVASTSICISF